MPTMREYRLLGISLKNVASNDILEDIKKYIRGTNEFCHIVSLNPENMVVASEDNEFKEIVETAQIQIVDGVGVALAGRLFGFDLGPRQTGVDTMEQLIREATRDSLSVVLIGGNENIAHELAECYNRIYGTANFFGVQGIKDIQNPTEEEEKELLSIVAARRPRLLFVSFGSPWQEKWIYRNRASLQGIICMGVGGAFNYLSGKVERPHRMIRAIGMEWLSRLISQPWRWKRQLRLIKFVWLVLKQRFGLI
jgi:N-acetylglucosaminyldiphosphoundecaprenol N-acetyl-beta-D-mannosaminyltransferase